MSESFLTKLATAETTVLAKGGTGSRTGAHPGDAYINKEGRLFGISNTFDKHFNIEIGETEGTTFIKVKEATPTGTDKKGKPTFDKTALKTSTNSTKMPFISVTKLCKQLFGDNRDDWNAEFNKVGEQDGYTYYALMDEEKDEKSTASEQKSDEEKDEKSTSSEQKSDEEAVANSTASEQKADEEEDKKSTK